MGTAPLLAALAVLFVLDAWSTIYILARGGREMNPALAWLMGLLGAREALLVVKLLAFAAIVWVADSLGPWLVAIVVVYAFVVAWNVRVIRKMKRPT